MNKNITGFLIFSALVLFSIVGVCVARGQKTSVNSDSPKIVGAYVRSEGRVEEIPNPNLMTHIFYAFGEVNDEYNGVDIQNPERFLQIVDLKKENPDLKILLTIGGTKFKGFHEMAAIKSRRKAFAKDCKRIVRQYNLDGIDLDWEFPGTELGGHSCGPEDAKNYGLVVKELRKQLGKDKLITFYSNNGAGFIDFDVMLPYIDYVMLSGYNLQKIPLHQSNLYPSEVCGPWSVSQSVDRHISKGIPADKILLGIPFYARWDSPANGRIEMGQYGFRTLRDKFGLHEVWDPEAQAPYFADEHGRLKASGDNQRSIETKARYLRDKGLSGAFYWHYTSEDSLHVMARTLRNALK